MAPSGHETRAPIQRFLSLLKGEVDRETYERQLGRLRTEKADRFEKLREAEKATDEATYLVTAQRVLELAKVAKSFWQQASLEQKRDLLARLVCNPRLAGRTMRYDLRKPYDVLARMRGSAGWRPYVEEFLAALVEFAA